MTDELFGVAATDNHWRTKAPCKGQPGFHQPDAFNPPDTWELSIQTHQALATCTTCPFKRECARAALTSGQGFDAEGSWVADGVVAAGIICRGDRKTRDTLNVIASGRIPVARATEAEMQARACVDDVPLFDLEATAA
ncbi:hypothetical protein CH289_07800 [Rhodococcus sp. RS1C4]|nr:WhiB family transcriptional regulator [Rhodococcus sp. RS1C4]OZC55087.1 hypothetical protein CH289_07800 [Rhodococcus sp. RS1C4]